MERNGVVVLPPPGGYGYMVLDRTGGTVARYSDDGRLVSRIGPDHLLQLRAAIAADPPPVGLGTPPSEPAHLSMPGRGFRVLRGQAGAQGRIARLTAKLGRGKKHANGALVFRRAHGDSVWSTEVDEATGLPVLVEISIAGKTVERMRHRYEAAGTDLMVASETTAESTIRDRSGRALAARTRMTLHRIAVGTAAEGR